MSKAIVRIPTTGPGNCLEIGTMDDGRLYIVVEELRYYGIKTRALACLDNSEIFSISEALKEVVRKGNGGQLPLWW